MPHGKLAPPPPRPNIVGFDGVGFPSFDRTTSNVKCCFGERKGAGGMRTRARDFSRLRTGVLADVRFGRGFCRLSSTRPFVNMFRDSSLRQHVCVRSWCMPSGRRVALLTPSFRSGFFFAARVSRGRWRCSSGVAAMLPHWTHASHVSRPWCSVVSIQGVTPSIYVVITGDHSK